MDLITAIVLFAVFIIISVWVIPYLLYKKSDSNTFSNWLQTVNLSIGELGFIFTCLSLILVFNQFTLILGLVLASYVLLYLNRKQESIQTVDKKYLFSFAIVFIVYTAILIYVSKTGLVSNENSLLKNTVFLLPVNLTILIMFFFGLRFKDFSWRFTTKSLVLSIIIYIIIKPLTFILFHPDMFDVTLAHYGLNFVHNLYYPSFIEEIVFRGLLLTGLVHYGCSQGKANMIHAVIFGLIHIINKDQLNVVTILSTSMQTYIGYLFGRMYFYTKSLSPGILFHALFNTI